MTQKQFKQASRVVKFIKYRINKRLGRWLQDRLDDLWSDSFWSKKIKKFKKSVDIWIQVWYNVNTMREGKPTKPAGWTRPLSADRMVVSRYLSAVKPIKSRLIGFSPLGILSPALEIVGTMPRMAQLAKGKSTASDGRSRAISNRPHCICDGGKCISMHFRPAASARAHAGDRRFPCNHFVTFL